MTANKNVNPALKNLAFLPGKWSMTLSNTSFLPDPKATLHGSASFGWVEDGNFLVMQQGVKGKTPSATWLIGRDESVADYSVFYFDDKKSSRIYQMSFAKGVWKMWRTTPRFTQRFSARVSRDKKTIKGSWEKSTDGKKWDHDFDLTYERRS